MMPLLISEIENFVVTVTKTGNSDIRLKVKKINLSTDKTQILIKIDFGDLYLNQETLKISNIPNFTLRALNNPYNKFDSFPIIFKPVSFYKIKFSDIIKYITVPFNKII